MGGGWAMGSAYAQMVFPLNPEILLVISSYLQRLLCLIYPFRMETFLNVKPVLTCNTSFRKIEG